MGDVARYFTRLILCLLFCTVVACVSERQLTRRMKTDESMRAAILTLVPIGTPIADAQRTMEQEGFSCHRGSDKNGRASLHCSRDDPTGFLVEQNWRIHLAFSNEKVSDVQVESYGTGP
jgi:hypothetical protein